MESYESVLLVKPEVFVFMIPPRTTNRGYRAADWNLNDPTWTGRLRLITKDGKCSIKLEDKTKGELFAECPIETYPGVAIEPVMDSSRYFVLRIQDENGRTAFIGLGFGDRSDSFDLNVALQDHFKWVKKEQQFEKESNQPELDLKFKEGQTIKINMKITKKDGSEGGNSSSSSKIKNKTTTSGSGGFILAPPPSSNNSGTSSSSSSSSNNTTTAVVAPPSTNVTPTVSPSHTNTSSTAAAVQQQTLNNWSDFQSSLDVVANQSTTSSSNTTVITPASTKSTDNWVQF